MHVLHAVQIYYPAPSGAARYFIEIGERLVQEQHRVTVLTSDACDLEHFWAAGKRHFTHLHDAHNGVQVQRFAVQRPPAPTPALAYPVLRRLMLEYSRLPLPPSTKLAGLRRMATLTPRLPQLQPYLDQHPALRDVALLHTTNITLDFMLIPLIAWAARRGIPHICTPFVHLGEPDNDTVRRYYSMPHQLDLLRQSAAVIVQTPRERAFLQQQGIPEHLLHTIGVGVTPSELADGDAHRFRQQHQIAPDAPLVLTIGTAAYDKGTPHVLAAMQCLWEHGIPAVWVQCGAQMQHFTNLVAHLAPADHERVRLLGYVDDQTRRDALAAAQVFALPSRTDSFGIVYLEAWCYGVPVIGALAGGVPDVITHGSDGLLVRFGDVAELAHALTFLITHPQRARAMGAVGWRKVQQGLTWEHKYQQVRAVYAHWL